MVSFCVTKPQLISSESLDKSTWSILNVFSCSGKEKRELREARLLLPHWTAAVRAAQCRLLAAGRGRRRDRHRLSAPPARQQRRPVANPHGDAATRPAVASGAGGELVAGVTDGAVAQRASPIVVAVGVQMTNIKLWVQRQ